MRNRLLVPAIVAGILLASFGSAFAADVTTTFSAISGNRSASATFNVNNGTLKVTLSNTIIGTNGDAGVPTDVLTAVFFDFNAPVGNLAKQFAYLPTGSSIISYQGNTTPNNQIPGYGNDVGGEWAFNGNLPSNSPQSAKYGISSTGLGLFAGNDNDNSQLFNPALNLAGPLSPDGVQYGIVGADDILGGNGGMMNHDFFIKHSVVFTLTGWTSNVNTDDELRNLFSKVNFQYGTALDEPNIPVSFITSVPVPTGVVLMGFGGLLLASYSARKSIKKVQVA